MCYWSKVRSDLRILTNEVNRMTFQFSHFSYPVYSSIRTMNMEGIAARGMYSRIVPEQLRGQVGGVQLKEVGDRQEGQTQHERKIRYFQSGGALPVGIDTYSYHQQADS